MIKLEGNFNQEFNTAYDVVVICTNGSTKKNGDNVMGKRGGAFMAMLVKPLPRALGETITRSGNSPYILKNGNHSIITMPTKKNYWDNEDRDFVIKNIQEVISLLKKQEGKKILVEYPLEKGDEYYGFFEELGDNVFVCR